MLLLGWVSFLTDVASEMIYPLLPRYLVSSLGASPAALGLIEGVAETTAAGLKLVSGRISDRLGRRKPLVVLGYLIAALARPLVALARSWPQVLAVRFADRVGKGIRTPPRDALLASLVPAAERGRAFGLQRAMDHAGAVAGPLVATALILGFGLAERTVFQLALLPGLLGVLLVAVKVPERLAAADAAHPEARAPEPPALAPSAPLPGPARLAIALCALFTLANSSDAFLILRAGDAGVAPATLPLLWAFLHLLKSALGSRGGALSDRFGRAPVIALGWTLYALSYIGFAVVASATATWAVFALYALHFALVEGAERAFIAELVPAGSRGRAFGAFHASQGLLALPASALFGLCWKLYGAPAAFLAGASLAAIATAALLVSSRLGYFGSSAGSPSRL